MKKISFYVNICEKDMRVLGDCSFYMILLYDVRNVNLILDFTNINIEYSTGNLIVLL